jgi:hypothetical protein
LFHRLILTTLLLQVVAVEVVSVAVAVGQVAFDAQ